MTSTCACKKSFWERYRREYAELLKLGFPVLLTQLGVIVMAFADTLMVGHYSTQALAASAFVNSLFLIPLVMLSGLAAGITPLVGALFSQGNHSESGRITRAGVQINAIISIIFMAVMTVIYFMLDRFGQPVELLPLIRPYYLTLLATLLPMAIFNAFTQTCNGMTDTRTPMWCVLFAIACNIFGNWLLIFGKFGFPELGLTGAGIATVIARIAGLVMIFRIYMRSRRYAPYRQSFRKPGHIAGQRRLVWVTSYPVMIQTGVECSLWSFGAVVCGWFGTIQLAAYQIINTIGQLGFMSYMSFGIAVSVRVANFTGLLDEKGAGTAARAGLHLNVVLATISSAIMWGLAQPLIRLFTDDMPVVEAATLFIFPLVLYQYLDAAQLTFMNAIRGTSQVKPLLWIAIVSYMIVGIPLALLFAVTFNWESIGVYYSFDVSLLVAAILAYMVFRNTRLKPINQ